MLKIFSTRSLVKFSQQALRKLNVGVGLIDCG